MTKKIFYILSVLVTIAAAWYSFQNSQLLQAEIDLFAKEQTLKIGTEKVEEEKKEDLENTQKALGEAEGVNAELIQSMGNMRSRENGLNKSKEKAQVEIAEHDAKLAELAAIKAKIDKKLEEELGGRQITWNQVPAEIKRLQEERKKKGDDLDLLNEHIEKLTSEVADKQASNTREGDRLTKIRTKIARNAKVGAITSVNSTWGFVIVNLGTNNSNVTPQSKLLVTRDGRLLGRLTPNSVEASQTVCDLNARDINPGVRIQPGDQVTLADSSTGQ